MVTLVRIDYKDAWYYVMNRGRRDESIFKGGWGYSQFVDLLKDLDKYSLASSVIERTKALLDEGRELRERLEKLHSMLSKTQKQT